MKPANSSQAEAWAVINALIFAHKQGIKSALVQCDFKHVVKYMKRQKLDELIPEGIQWSFRHVKGHVNPKAGSRFYVNGDCDRRAKRHMKAWRSEIEGET